MLLNRLSIGIFSEELDEFLLVPRYWKYESKQPCKVGMVIALLKRENWSSKMSRPA